MLRQHPLTPWLGALGLHALLLVMFQTRADPTQPPVPLVTEVVMLAAEAVPTPPAPAPKQPSMLDVMMTSVNIMQMRITRSRMAGDPPEVMIAPQLAHLGLMDFYRAEEAIAEGQRAAEKTLPFLQQLGLGAV